MFRHLKVKHFRIACLLLDTKSNKFLQYDEFMLGANLNFRGSLFGQCFLFDKNTPSNLISTCGSSSSHFITIGAPLLSSIGHNCLFAQQQDKLLAETNEQVVVVGIHHYAPRFSTLILSPNCISIKKFTHNQNFLKPHF